MQHTDKLPGQISLKQVVMDVLEDRGIDSRHYKNMIRWAIRGCSKLSMFHIDVYEEVRLTPNSLNVCTVPDDYVNWVAIGYPYRGRFFTVSRDGSIITTTTTVEGQETLDIAEGEGVVRSSDSQWHYGESGGKNQYSITWINDRQFVLSGTPPRAVSLRYVSTGVKNSEETLIPAICEEALIAYVKMMWAEKLHESMNDISYWNQKWVEAQEELRFVQFPSMEDIADAVYETWTQTVKR